jgi:drug/metabolite transporter (DMT)-like permease
VPNHLRGTAEPASSAALTAALPPAHVNNRSLSRQSGIWLSLAITLLWGINWPASKVAVSEIPVWTFRSISLLGGGCGLLLCARIGGLRLGIRRAELAPTLLTTFFNVTAWQLLSAFGLIYMPSGRASILALTMPLWAALLSVPLLGERLTLPLVISLGLGLVGLGAMMAPQAHDILMHPFGICLMLAAAISWALGTVLFKFFKWTSPTSVLIGWQLVLGGIPVLIGALVADQRFDIGSISGKAWLAIAYTTLAAMIFCQWGWLKVAKQFPTAIAGLGIVAIPAVGVVSGALLLGEKVGADVFISLIATMAALVVALFRPKSR